MRSSLRAAWLGVNASYWFLPTVLSVAALLLSLLTVEIDRSGAAAWLNEVAWLHPSRPDGARSQLTVIATSMISVASTVFAITIAAVAYASGSYGPRLLTNFMQDRGNQVSLAVFIATFVYNLMVLRVVRSAQEAAATIEGATATPLPGFVPQLSLLVSAASVIVAVGVLVYFLHHIPASIRINSVLAGIGRRLVADIETRFPEGAQANEPVAAGEGQPVEAADIGYIEIIDFRELGRLAEEAGVTVALKVRTGDFVHPHLPLIEVSGGNVTDKLAERLHGCFSLGASRTPTQDLEFLIDELVEIALRALSPGINDPFTAITSLHWMGAAMAKLADRDLCRGPEQDEYDPERVRPVADGFEHFLKRSFGGVRASAAANVMAGKIFIDTLFGVATGTSSRERVALLRDEARLLMRQAETELAGPALEELRKRLENFEQAVAGKAA